MNRIGDTLLHVGSNERLVRSLVAHGVQFVVIGGLAVSWFCRQRQAVDMDLLLNSSPENASRIAEALASLGLSGFSKSSFAELGMHAPLKDEFFADLLTPNVVGPSYAEVVSGAVEAKLFNIPIFVANPAMQIRMKTYAVACADAQQTKHLADIECLKEHVA